MAENNNITEGPWLNDQSNRQGGHDGGRPPMDPYEQRFQTIEGDIRDLKKDVGFIRESMATKADLEKMGRVMSMWTVTAVAATPAILALLLKFLGAY